MTEKYIKAFGKFNESESTKISKYNTEKYEFHKYPLNERLIELFNKYNTIGYDDLHVDNWGDIPSVSESDVIESMKRINGNGELDGRHYVEHFDKDIALVIHGSAFGLTGKYKYRYEINVVYKTPSSSTQIGGGYGASGFISNQYNYLSKILPDNNPQIYSKDFIGNVINDFRTDIINYIDREVNR